MLSWMAERVPRGRKGLKRGKCLAGLGDDDAVPEMLLEGATRVSRVCSERRVRWIRGVDVGRRG